MNSLPEYYSHQITKYKTKLAAVKKQLFASSMLRLIIFVLSAVSVYFVFGNTKLVLGIVLLTIILFLFLVSRHSDLQYKRDKLLALIGINETEIKVLQRNFHNLPTGDIFKDANHYFSQDIDLFGKASFYQYCNRTALKQGSETLAGLFTANSINNIENKQEAIKELAEKTEWRQEFSAIATLVKTAVSYNSIIKWLQEYKSFVPKIMKLLPIVFSLVSVALITLYFFNIVSGLVVLLLFFLGLGITGAFLKKINTLSAHTGQIQSTFHQYQKLILEIENIEFTSELLKEKKAGILSNGKKTSAVLKEFSKILAALDQRNNMLFGFFANAFLLWDLQQCYKIEQWVKNNGLAVEKWFNTIAFFDAYNSLGNFSFNHTSYTYPEIIAKGAVLKSEAAGHPLLDPAKSVLNDMVIGAEEFFIITGANMAGKSTFLRTVSLQIVMANVGLPVCAKKATYNPIKLITSMRTTDSLTDDESYFFSELKRLKFVVDEIQKDRYFIVLDEILKGTNSTDKAIGSRKFVEKLVDSKSTGIIATHDLSLCEIVAELPQVKNHYFDAEIINDELHFDYKFKNGICQNMNASFLLKKMEIVE